MGRQGRHLRIRFDFQYNRTLRRQRFVPRRPQFLGIIDIDALKTDHLRKAMIGDIRNGLRSVELGISLHHPLLPGDLVEILIVEDVHHPARIDPLAPVFGDGDELGHVAHLHGPIANEANDGTIRMRKFGGNGVGNRCAHGRETA